jgi:hypothetical protein
MPLTGCANLSSLQTARVFEPNTGEFTVGGGLSHIPFFSSNIDTLKKYGDGPLIPYGDIGVRWGVYPRIDIGVRYTPLYTLALDGKYQLYAGKSLALATGVGLGILHVEDADSTSLNQNNGDDENDVTMVDFIIPLYASYDFGEYFTAYVSPKFVHRRFPGFDANAAKNLAGGSAGFKIGKSRGLYLELTRMKFLGTSITSNQWSIAWFMKGP